MRTVDAFGRQPVTFQPVAPLNSPVSFRRVPGLAAFILSSMLLFAAPEAFSAVLVKNIGQTDASVHSLFTRDQAQGFRTGGHAAGYTVNFVLINVNVGPAADIPVYTLGIWSESGGTPNQLLGTLAQVSSTVTTGGNTFTHPGIDLAANTNYFLVLDVSRSGNKYRWVGTTSDDEDAGKADGWEISNTTLRKPASGSGAWGSLTAIDDPREIRIDGDLKSATNTAPTAANNTIETNEDTAYTFTAADFQFSDIDTGDTLEAVTIVTLPASDKGTLTLNGSSVTANASFNRTQIDSGSFKYSPPANAHGDGYASFTFKVRDGGRPSADSYTMSIRVLRVNDAPTGDLAIQGTAKRGKTLTVDLSNLADVDGLPTNADDFTVNWQHADTIGTNIAADTRTYTLTSSEVGENLRVEVKYQDRDGTDETVVLDSWPGTGTVLDNTAPTASDGTVTMDQDTQYTFTAANFNFSDADSTDTLASVTIVAPPASGKGTLTLSGSSVSANDSVGSTDIAAGNLKYAPPANASGDDYASFTFKVSDGVDASANSYTMTIDVADTAAPTVSSATAEGSSLVVTFNEPLAAAASLPNSAFAVKKTPSGGTEEAVSLSGSPSISGAAVTLTLATALASTDTGVKVSYTKPTSGTDNKLADAAANEVADFADRTVSSPTLSMSVSSSSIAEAAGTSTVTVGTGVGPTFTSSQTITLTLSGTATETDDFTIVSKSLTLAAGATSATTTVTAVQDTIDDEAETVIITASEGGNAIGTQTVTITDDDDAPTLSISVNNAGIAEAAGTSTVTVSTAVDATFAADQTITLALTGTATEADDFTIVSKSLTLAAGATSATTTVTAVQDTIDDDAETIIVTASNGGDTIGSATVTITDDDAAPVLSVSVNNASVAEAAGTSTVTVGTDTGTTFATDQTITLSLTGTATEGDDFSIGSKTLTLPAGSGTAAASITTTITAVQDTIDDDAETILIDAARTTGVTTSVDVGTRQTVTITDDDAAPVLSVSVNNASVAEAAGTSTVTVGTDTGTTFATAQTITLSLTGTATEGDDFGIGSKTLTLPAGSGTAAASITTTITAVQDRIDDDAETILIDAARTTGVTTSVDVGTRQTVTITDDDAAPVLSVSVNNASVAEAAGTSTVTVGTATGSTFATAQTITLSLTGTATEGDDFSIGSKTLTLPAGSGTAAASITTTITAVQDTINDDAETIIVTASNGGDTIGSQTVTITDDDAGSTLSISVNNASIAEAAGTSTVTVGTGAGTTFASAQTITLTLTGTAGDSRDYGISSESLTLAAGATTVTATVTAVDDNYDDDAETIIVTASNGGDTIGTATITITDDDDAPAFSFIVSDSSLSETGEETATDREPRQRLGV